MFRHTPEDLKKRLMSYFENDYPAFINQVEADHVDDPVTIAPFKELIYGDATRVKEIKAWPALAITSADSFPIERTQQHFVALWQTQIYCRYFIRNSVLGELEKIVDRHIEATLKMFEVSPYKTLGGLATSFEFLRAEKTDSILPEGASIYIRGLEVQWEVRHS